jgi:hypothetical protein
VTLKSVAEPQRADVPQGIVALFSCSAGQESFEHPELKHSVFFYQVLQAWKGKAGRDGTLTLDELADYVKRETKTFARTRLDRSQTPLQRGEFSGTWVLRGDQKEPTRPDDRVRLTAARTEAGLWGKGLEVKVRKAGEADFTPGTPQHAIGIAAPRAVHQLLYLSEEGSGAAVARAQRDEPAGVKPPTWWRGLELRVRRGGEADFNKDTRKYGLEVFRDGDTGYLVYLCDTGSIAVAPVGDLRRPSTPKAPTWWHGMELRVRRAGEADFTPGTRKYGIEVFRDENTGNLV